MGSSFFNSWLYIQNKFGLKSVHLGGTLSTYHLQTCSAASASSRAGRAASSFSSAMALSAEMLSTMAWALSFTFCTSTFTRSAAWAFTVTSFNTWVHAQKVNTVMNQCNLPSLISTKQKQQVTSYLLCCYWCVNIATQNFNISYCNI